MARKRRFPVVERPAFTSTFDPMPKRTTSPGANLSVTELLNHGNHICAIPSDIKNDEHWECDHCGKRYDIYRGEIRQIRRFGPMRTRQ